MAKLQLVQGTTSKSVGLFVQNSSSTTGAGLTGLAYNTAGLTAYYWRPGGSSTAITLATLGSVTASWSSGGFIEVDSTNMPGVYRLDLPNAVLASGATSVIVLLKGASNMAPCVLEIELTAVNNQDAVRFGMTALPNAAAAASGGVPVLGTNGASISFTAGVTISSTTGDALTITSSGGNGDGLKIGGNGSGNGISVTGGATGSGIRALGGTTSGDGITATAQGTGTGVAANITGNITGNLSGSIGTVSAGGVTRASFAADTGLQSIRSGTAQAGASNSITLDASASATDNYYKSTVVYVTGGTGAGQARFINAYVGSTKVASVFPNWAVTPDNTSTFSILPYMSTLSDLIENGYSLGDMSRGWSAALLGISNGLSGTSVVYRDTANTVDRIAATVDTAGDRSAVTLTLT